MIMTEDSIGMTKRAEVLSRLYALRAGLSVVASERAAADSIMSNAETSKAAASKAADGKLNKAKERKTRELAAIGVEECGAKIREANTEIAKLQSDAESTRLIWRVLYIITMGILSVAALACWIAGAAWIIAFQIWIFGIIKAPDWGFFNIFFSFVEPGIALEWSWLFIVAVFCADLPLMVGCGLITASPFVGLWILFFYRAPKNSYFEKRRAIAKTKRLTEKVKNLELELSRKQETYNVRSREMDDYISNVRNENKNDLAVAQNEYDVQKQKAIEHAVAGLMVIDGLEETFDDMIDARDWSNVDLLIYSIETRRAEDMKEALTYVDGERRTERIESAIAVASREVSTTINNGLGRLQGTMTKCFTRLGNIIIEQSERIMEYVEDLGSEIGRSMRSAVSANNAYLQQLSSQQSMTNALLAQSNKTSSAMAADVSGLRTSTEYAQARLLYKMQA